MKKQYNAPKMSTHGNVEAITQAFGASSATDTIFFNGEQFGAATGSVDGDITPVGRQ
ncbi:MULTISPECIES: lasso peptide [unclassified Anabaena]|uniref:lasso peptide n=1 Tax=unclassified Anabaena TaxID=2619674 RepID=UPI0039C6847B